MEILATLMQGFTPILLFIFICLVALLIMFYGAMRGLDEMVKGIRDERVAIADQMTGIKLRLEDMVNFQSEISCLLRRVLENGTEPVLQPFVPPVAPLLSEDAPAEEVPAEAVVVEVRDIEPLGQAPLPEAAPDAPPVIDFAQPPADALRTEDSEQPPLAETIVLGAAAVAALGFATSGMAARASSEQSETLPDEPSPASKRESAFDATLDFTLPELTLTRDKDFELVDSAPRAAEAEEAPRRAVVLTEQATIAALSLDPGEGLTDLLTEARPEEDRSLTAKLDLVTGLSEKDPEPDLTVSFLGDDMDETVALSAPPVEEQSPSLLPPVEDWTPARQEPGVESGDEPESAAYPPQEDLERIPTLDELFLEEQVATATAELKKSGFGEIDPLSAALPEQRPLPDLNFDGLAFEGLDQDQVEKTLPGPNALGPDKGPDAGARPSQPEPEIQPRGAAPAEDMEPVFFLSDEDQEERGDLPPLVLDRAAADLPSERAPSGLGDLSTLEDITFDDIEPTGGPSFEAKASGVVGVPTVTPAMPVLKDEEDLSLEHDIAALEDILNMDDEGGVRKARENLVLGGEPADASAEPPATPQSAVPVKGGKSGKTQDNILDFILED